ncbi:hypothetical protein [Pseudomonas sp. Marseille-Q5299]|uniref:hypothetical protein n=1 Tax=Pseudomonas sp. Marseille-Q5299 TaxID=2942201 RepID=UPI0020746312|nr:hypothetical protein [Pseudomonas sp. Marseille-Q5299]
MRTLLMLGALLAAPAFADILEPSHDCTQPDIPYEFENSYERDQFLADAEEYKSCIADFVEEQEEAMRKHKSAADSAVEEWNSFAGSI